MRSALLCLVVGVFLSLPFVASAQSIAYAAGNDTLYRIDFGTRRAEQVGTFSVPGAPIQIFDVEGLAFAPDGVLFGVVDNLPGGALIRVNTATGRATIVGDMGLQGQGANGSNNRDFGLAATCDGRLFASSDTSSRLWEVNRDTGATRLVGDMGAKISGLASKADGLYGFGVDGDEGLYKLDTETAHATLIAHLTGLNILDAGLDFDAAGNLWAVLDLTPVFFSDIARIDLTTGLLADRSRVTGNGLDGGVNSKELEALAISPPICEPGGFEPTPPAPIPALSQHATLGAAVMFALAGLVGIFSRRHPVCRKPSRCRQQ